MGTRRRPINPTRVPYSTLTLPLLCSLISLSRLRADRPHVTRPAPPHTSVPPNPLRYTCRCASRDQSMLPRPVAALHTTLPCAQPEPPPKHDTAHFVRTLKVGLHASPSSFEQSQHEHHSRSVANIPPSSYPYAGDHLPTYKLDLGDPIFGVLEPQKRQFTPPKTSKTEFKTF